MLFKLQDSILELKAIGSVGVRMAFAEEGTMSEAIRPQAHVCYEIL